MQRLQRETPEAAITGEITHMAGLVGWSKVGVQQRLHHVEDADNKL